MNTPIGRLSRALLLGAVLALGQGGLAHAASPSASPPSSPPSTPTGNEMLSVTPSLISVSVKPGATATAELTLRAAAALDVKIVPQGLAQTPDGNLKSVPQSEDASPYSARSMMTAAPESLQLKPGDTRKVTVTISVPTGAGEGTRYAILDVVGLPATGDKNVGFGVDLGVSTLVTVAGTAQDRTGAISDITIGKALPGQPLPVTVALTNTGNTHYGATPDELVATATLQDASGNLVAKTDATSGRLSLVPTFVRDLALTLDQSKPLADGRYHLEVGAGLKDGTVLDQKAMDFQWSGGAVLGATGAPVQTPVATGTSSVDPLMLVLASLVGGAVVVLVFLVAQGSLRRRRRAPGGPSDT